MAFALGAIGEGLRKKLAAEKSGYATRFQEGMTCCAKICRALASGKKPVI
jgi:hypothetical protein